MPSTRYHSKFHLTAIAPVAVTPLPLRSHPPPIVLAHAGTHPRPPHSACSWEDGDDNPSFVPAPFRYSRPLPVVLADAGTHPRPPRRACPWEDGDDQSIFRSSSLPLLPPPFPLSSRMRGPIPIPRKEPALGKTGTTIHLSSQLPSVTPAPPPLSSRMRGPIPVPREEPAPGKTGTTIHLSSQLPSVTPAPPVVLAHAGTHPRPPQRACPREDGDDNPSFVPTPFRYSRPPFPLSSRMRGPIFPTPPHHPQPAVGASLAGTLPVPVPIRPPSLPSYSFPLTFRRRRGRRNASYTATQSSIDVLPTASPINSNGRSSSFRNRTQDFPMFIRFPVAL